jgi:hypothetical protein
VVWWWHLDRASWQGLENAALAIGGKLTTLKGGVPMVVNGRVIGGVGAGAGTGEPEAEIVKVEIEALMDALKRTRTEPLMITGRPCRKSASRDTIGSVIAAKVFVDAPHYHGCPAARPQSRIRRARSRP